MGSSKKEIFQKQQEEKKTGKDDKIKGKIK